MGIQNHTVSSGAVNAAIQFHSQYNFCITKQSFIGIRLWLLLALLLACQSVLASNKAYLVEVDGAIGPVSQDLIIRTLEKANAESVHLVILEMNTPGGLDHSMRKIISAILASRVPVVTYVSPPGSRAASAGTYILYASHIAAMSPATNLGAATPVQIGGLPKVPDMPTTPVGKDEKPTATPAEKPKSSMDKKIINDATAYIKGLAKLRGRNEEWAEQAVREAVSLTSVEALEMNVIDILATDLADLFIQLQGREVRTNSGVLTLVTEALTVERITPDWRSRLLSIITNPNVAYILMLIGIYGLIIEFSNPGSILPGVTGAISLLLALYAFQILPINYAGLALVAVGLTFIIAEVFISSGGILGIGGVIAFVIGSIILFDDENLAVSLPLIGGTAAVAAGFMFWVLNNLARMRRKKVVSGMEYMIGLVGEAMQDFTGEGRVHIEGESWLAKCNEPLKAGQKVRINAVDHLVLQVSPVEKT